MQKQPGVFNEDEVKRVANLATGVFNTLQTQQRDINKLVGITEQQNAILQRQRNPPVPLPQAVINAEGR